MATRTAWVDVYEELHGRELAELAAEELEALADAAWWTSRVDESIAARQKAYARYGAGTTRAAQPTRRGFSSGITRSGARTRWRAAGSGGRSVTLPASANASSRAI